VSTWYLLIDNGAIELVWECKEKGM